MLRPKATAALMKLKEIDRKYKMKSNEEVKLRVDSSPSDISGIDEISKHEASDDGKATTAAAKPITNTRPKLDIRMPDAHIMEQSSKTLKENGPELVAIYTKPAKEHPLIKSDSNISSGIIRDENAKGLNSAQQIAGEEKPTQITSSRNSFSLEISEDQVINTESSISEDVPEVFASSHPVSNHLKADVSQEITLKSVDSIIDSEERVQSDLDEGPSTLVDSGTYSDDFVKTISTENARESNTSPENYVMLDKAEALKPELTTSQVKYATSTPPSYYQRQGSPKLDKDTEPETEDTEELVSGAKAPEVEPNLHPAPDLGNRVKRVEDIKISEETESPAVLYQQRSSPSSSSRRSKERQRRPKAHQSSSSGDSKSAECLSSFMRKKEPETTNTSETLNPSESNLRSAGKISAVTNSQDNKMEKDLKNPQSISMLETEVARRQAHANSVSRSPKDKLVAVRIKSKHLKSDMRPKDSTIKETPPNYSAEMSKTQKCRSTERVPVTTVGPVSFKFLEISKKHNDNCSHDERTSEHRAIPHGQKRRSNKPKTEDFPRSKHRTKTGSLRQKKNQTREEPGLGHEVKEVAMLRQQMKEFRLEQEQDQLRSRVRGYVKEMLIEQRRPSTHDGGFGGPNHVVCHSGPGFRRIENFRSLFFKPLDLPNVAAFERPDYEDDQASGMNNDKYLHLDTIRERILEIRHWLKQQFVLYKDYSSLVSTINSKYMPVTLEETKKMILDMQRFYDSFEKRRCER